MEKVVKEARTIAGFEDVPLYFESEEEIKRLDIEEARQHGIEESKKETIMNMLKDNVDLSIISKYTNTSIDQIKEIIENNS